MQRAQVIGHATATLKHPSINNTKLLIVQPLGANQSPNGYPLLVVDTVGAGRGDIALITSDGRFARSFLDSDQTPVRWTLIGIEDSRTAQG